MQEVAAQYAGRVTFVSENFGASELADRFGVKGYPAVFVADILVAAPREFGYFGEVEGSGRYAPWRNEANQAKFKSDLTRMIDLILAGKKEIVSEWLGELQRRHGDQIAILALAVESPEDQIRSTASSLGADLHWAVTDAATALSFGDITAVPTLFLFDRSGKTLRVLYGAPPDLHDQVEKSLAPLLN